MGGVLSSTLLTLEQATEIYTILDDAKVSVGKVLARLPRPSFRRKAAPAWQLAPAAVSASPSNGFSHATYEPESTNGYANGHANGYTNGRVNGRANGHTSHAVDSVIESTVEERPAPSGRRTIRVITRRGPAPAV
jgi:hypothetical protein